VLNNYMWLNFKTVGGNMKNSECECRCLNEVIYEMFKKSPNAVILSDKNGDILLKNNTFNTLFKGNPSNIFKALNINSKQVISELKIKGEYVIEKISLLLNDCTYYFKANFYFICLNEKEYIALILNDITEPILMAKKIEDDEAMLKKIFNGIEDMIFMTDLECKVTYYSASVSRILGYDSKELIGTNLQSIVHPEDLDEAKKKFYSYLNGEPIIDNVNYRLLSKNGEYIWVSFSHISFIEENSKKIRTIIILREIAERLRLQMEWERLSKELEYEKLKSEFISKVSHELRTPLNVIYGIVQLLEIFRKNDATFIENYDKFYPVLKQNMYRLLRLTNNIIDLTSIDAGCMGLNLENVNIVSLIEDICTSANNYFNDKNIKIIYNPHFEEKYIACDVEKIEKIILNILSNAVKFSKEDKKIFVEVSEDEENIFIIIKDNGIGIPDELQKVIFDRFKQADFSFTRKNEGSGIGLSIAQEFVKMHGGEILLNSKEGEGSEFIIRLPKNYIQDEVAATKIVNKNHLETVNIEFSDIQ